MPWHDNMEIHTHAYLYVVTRGHMDFLHFIFVFSCCFSLHYITVFLNTKLSDRQEGLDMFNWIWACTGMKYCSSLMYKLHAPSKCQWLKVLTFDNKDRTRAQNRLSFATYRLCIPEQSRTEKWSNASSRCASHNFTGSNNSLLNYDILNLGKKGISLFLLPAPSDTGHTSSMRSSLFAWLPRCSPHQ